MTGAMYAAIAGLKAHMSKLNVVGNNIANVNTQGYKSQRTIFSDSLYTTQTSGSNGTDVVGGRNPSQYGYGVQVTSIDTDMSSGNYSPTGRPLDCMINGQGFFLTGDKDVAKTVDPTDPETLKSFTLTRVGNFEFKADGYLAKEDSDAVIYGFMCIGRVNGEPIFSDQLVPIRYPRMEKNADGSITVHYAKLNTDPDGKIVLEDDTNFPQANVDNVKIDPSTGVITANIADSDEVITIGVIAVANVTNPNGVTHLSNQYYKAGPGAGDMQVALMGGIGEQMWMGTKNPAAGETVLDPKLYTKGIGQVNGSQLPANTTAPDGMTVVKSSSKLQTGGLEGSKTDLATEISEMITTQRGYQANTRIITVTDSMLEELVNMKR